MAVHRECQSRGSSSPHSHCENVPHAFALGHGASSAFLTLVIGIGAMLWLVLRSGPKPSRLSYPCQQSAFGLASAAFGVPLVAAIVAGRAKLIRFMHTGVGKIGVVGIVILSLVLITHAAYGPPSAAVVANPPLDYHPAVYLVNNAQRGALPSRFIGVDALVTLMGMSGLKWHRSPTVETTSGPDGLIDRDDIVVVKINAQWSQRGGTNTDVLRGILRRIVEHPGGFVGEIVVADNGQGYGNLDRTENNAEDIGQSPQDVVSEFAAQGWKVSTKLWDSFRTVSVDDYSSGNLTDGYVVNAVLDPQTAIRVSYPKFRTPLGTYISYKNGIWDPVTQSYNHDRLVVINVPVLKTHSIYAVTAAVKNHMGVITQSLSTDSHASVGRGGLGSFLAEVRVPDLTILDCIWVLAMPGQGPNAAYAQSNRRDQLVASRDPVALDAWAVKNILIPQIVANGYTAANYSSTQDPDNPNSTFRRYLDRSMSEMLLAGIATTNDYNAVQLFVADGSVSIPTVSQWGLAAMTLLVLTAGTLLLMRSRAETQWPSWPRQCRWPRRGLTDNDG